MIYLFFDTETAGLAKDYNAPYTNVENWPRLVQLGFIVTDGFGNILHQEESTVKPGDFHFDPKAVATHGITEEWARAYGASLIDVLQSFSGYVNLANVLVAHNMNFDYNVISCEMFRSDLDNVMLGKERVCTMTQTTAFCELPAKYGKEGYKFPRLAELYLKLFGRDMGDAHNALVDIDNTRKCFFELKRRGIL